MFCPQCGREAPAPYKFCKSCGANLYAVKKALAQESGVTSADTTDWPAVAYNKLKDAIDSRKKSDEEKRLEEIKAGVITTLVGVGTTFFLYFLMTAIAATVPENEVAILLTIRWIGLVPLLIGLGLLFNGLVISKRAIRLKQAEESRYFPPESLPVVDTSPMRRLSEPPISDFSVTEPTTTRLREPAPVESERSSESS